MENVRVAAVAAAIDAHNREKRARSTSGVTGVCDKRRNTVFMTIRGTDDMPQRVQSKADDWEPAYIAQAAQSLRGNITPATEGNDMVDDDDGD
eukprot:3682701-Pyramimonas_sp.AAC.1